MSIEVHIDWQRQTHLVGRLHAAEHGSSVSFEYTPEWLQREDAFAIDPTSLPLQRGAHHGKSLFGAIQDCGPDRWGRILIERAVRKKVLAQKPYRDVDYVLALDDTARVGALRFRVNAESPFLAVTTGKLPPLVRLNALLRATDAIHSETETAQDLRFLLGAGSPLGGARPKSAVSLADERLAIAKFPKPDDTRDIAAGEILALTLAAQAGIQVAEHRLVPVGGNSVAVITRFDRVGTNRIPFISAASLLGLGAALRAAVAGDRAGAVCADGSGPGTGGAGGFWSGRLGAGERQTPPAAFVSDRLEPFAEGLQRSGLAADDREFHPVPGKCVSLFWWRAPDAGH
jgi:serine/threonine-protein kinase HipA